MFFPDEIIRYCKEIVWFLGPVWVIPGFITSYHFYGN